MINKNSHRLDLVARLHSNYYVGALMTGGGLRSATHSSRLFIFNAIICIHKLEYLVCTRSALSTFGLVVELVQGAIDVCGRVSCALIDECERSLRIHLVWTEYFNRTPWKLAMRRLLLLKTTEKRWWLQISSDVMVNSYCLAACRPLSCTIHKVYSAHLNYAPTNFHI